MADTKEDILAGIEDGSIGDKLFTPLTAVEVDALVDSLKTDSGAPFETEALVRIAATKRADLAAFERLRSRLKEAKVRVSELDNALEKLVGKGGPADATAEVEKDRGGQGSAIVFAPVEQWHEPMDGKALLDDIVTQTERYVMMAHEFAVVIALWVIHSYCFNAFQISPRLAILSPEKRCGKTTLLRFLQVLVPKALAAANITAAAMFRTIEKYRPTLLIDEADTFLPDNEELRGVINSGHERHGQMVRLVGDDFEPRAFSTFCPTAIAAIGSLSGTITDRALTIAMRRRLANEHIDHFRLDRADHLHELARKAARWTADNVQELKDADPVMPEALHDRACDNWRGLFAIADLAGGDWPEKARAAALALAAQGAEQDDQSRNVMLLADICRIFDHRQKSGQKAADRISSTDLVIELVILDTRPWATWARGKAITPAAVARMLKAFGIVPNTVKLSDGRQPNGYKLSQFADAFARYLPQPPGSPVQSSPPSPTPANPGRSGQSQSSPQRSSGERPIPAKPLEEDGVGERGELPPPKIEKGGGGGRLGTPTGSDLGRFFGIPEDHPEIVAAARAGRFTRKPLPDD